MASEFCSFEKDLITGYAPDIETMKRKTRERDKQFVQSWHNGDNLVMPVDRTRMTSEMRKSFNNIRELQQKTEESGRLSWFQPVAKLLGIA